MQLLFKQLSKREVNHILVNFTVFHLINQKKVYVIVVLLFFSLQIEANFKEFCELTWHQNTYKSITTKGAETIDHLLESARLYLEYDLCLYFREEVLYQEYQMSTSLGPVEAVLQVQDYQQNVTELKSQPTAFSNICTLGFQN